MKAPQLLVVRISGTASAASRSAAMSSSAEYFLDGVAGSPGQHREVRYQFAKRALDESFVEADPTGSLGDVQRLEERLPDLVPRAAIEERAEVGFQSIRSIRLARPDPYQVP
jgi:hypothetical protein